MTENNFCTQCGAEMRPDMNFCPKCGAVAAGSETEKERIEAFEKMAMESRFMWVKFLLIIYAIPAILVGLVGIINADLNANTLWDNQEFQKWAIGIGIKSVETLKSYLMWAGVIALISGLGATLSMYAVCVRKFWMLAVIGCIIATIFSIWSFIGVFVGIFVTWMIFDLKEYFPESTK